MCKNETELYYSCILFDLDGTVLDTVSDCTSAINRTMDVFSLPKSTEKQVQSYLNNGARVLIKRALPENLRNDEGFVDKVLSTYIEFYKEECIKSSVLYDGIYDCLKQLKEKGAKLGIVTNKPDLQTQIMVPHYFGDIFDYIQGNSPTVPTKPDAKRVEMALSALGKEKEQTIFVGDSWVDTETARNSKIACIGVSWGFSGREGFKDHMPDVIVDTAKEIVSIAENGL
jgi:phosphoglycolate phosphatase